MATWSCRFRRLATLVISVAAMAHVMRADAPRAEKDAAAETKQRDDQAKAALADTAQQAADLVKAAIRAIQRKSREPAPVPETDPELVIKHYVSQFTPQFRPLVATELRLIRSVCEPTPPQLRAIRAAGDARLKQVIRKYAEVHKRWRDGGYRSDEELGWPDARYEIVKSLSESVGQTLSANQAKRYEQNLEERAAARKQAALLGMIARLDQELLLSGEQRDKLTRSLNENWQDAWTKNLETLQHSDRYMPSISDDQVLPILSPIQKEIWNGAKKRPIRLYGWTGFGFVQPLDEEAEQAAENEKAAETNEEKAEKVGSP